MKLFAKYNRINIASTIIIFLLGSTAFFLLLRYIVIKQVDEDLKIEKNEILTYVNRFHRLPNIIEVHDQYTTYKKLNSHINSNKIYTHKVYEENQHEKELQRTIEFTTQVTDGWYQINVSKSMEAADDLIQTIIIITVTLILLILFATFIINRIILRKLWKPFYVTLEKMRQFNLSDANKVSFGATNIEEFSYLDKTLSQTLGKAQQDYKTLKEFTENASHELQTPLAVIQSKLDILIQSEHLSQGESSTIQSAYNAVQGLTRLNQSLLLLAKIENKQFSEQTGINVKQLINDKMDQFAELWKSRNITVTASLSEKEISANAYLVEILLNNLLSNATKHNVENGFIEIVLDEDLRITNTGASHSLNEESLYKRFSSESKEAGNHGLGLSIIQQICNSSGFTCTYSFHQPDKHSFLINW